MKDASQATFTGPFAKLCYKFIAYKRSLGFNYTTVAEVMELFDTYTEGLNLPKPVLTREVVNGWIKKKPYESANTQQTRITAIRQFAIYLTDLGYDAYILPPQKRGRSKQYVPYIFTRDEMKRIFKAADNQPFVGQHPHSHITTPVWMRLLYGCGLRISEVSNLCLRDVNLHTGVLHIRKSKFGKERLIPLSPSLLKVFRYYASKMYFSADTDFFFPNRRKERMSSNGCYAKFRSILWESGISHGGRGKGPRLHDLRHTFAVHSLDAMARRGIDIYSALPILGTYLGHTKLTTTGQYLRLTPELYPDIVEAINLTCGTIFPEVCDL